MAGLEVLRWELRGYRFLSSSPSSRTFESIPHHFLRKCINYFFTGHLLTSISISSSDARALVSFCATKKMDSTNSYLQGGERLIPKWSRKFSCHYCCRSLGQQMLYCVTAASWLSYLGVNKRQWWSWSDLELMTVVIFSMKKRGVACGGKLLHTCNAFRQFWCDIHPAEVLTTVVAFLGSVQWGVMLTYTFLWFVK